MNDKDKLSDWIPRYLNRQLSDSEQEEFERELSRNDDLRAEVLEMSRIHIGLHVSDCIESGHIRSELLVSFAENPNRLNKNVRDEINEHLHLCNECSEELEFCRQSFEQAKNVAGDPSRGGFTNLFRAVFKPQMMIRPVTAYAAVMLLVVFGYFGVQQVTQSEIGVTVFELDPSAARGQEGENIIIVDEISKVVRLEFRIAIQGETYSLAITRPDGTVVISKPSSITPAHPQNTFAFEIPTSYLPTGWYYLKVNEMDSAGQILDTRRIEFEIKSE